MALRHLKDLWEKRDQIDHLEGLIAYQRYNEVMRLFGEYYSFPIDEVCSAFVALSPNNDYVGNLRSLASVLQGYSECIPVDRITVTTYSACRNRAYSYLGNQVSFLDTVKGPKIRAFRDNIMRPDKSPLVTVDGHIALAWHGKEGTMKDAARLIERRNGYIKIAADVTDLAVEEGIAPCQAQAILWLTRKRVFNIKFDAQLSIFGSSDDTHKTLHHPEDIKPYKLKGAA